MSHPSEEGREGSELGELNVQRPCGRREPALYKSMGGGQSGEDEEGRMEAQCSVSLPTKSLEGQVKVLVSLLRVMGS